MELEAAATVTRHRAIYMGALSQELRLEPLQEWCYLSWPRGGLRDGHEEQEEGPTGQVCRKIFHQNHNLHFSRLSWKEIPTLSWKAKALRGMHSYPSWLTNTATKYKRYLILQNT
jgi:hypothetical protein